MQINSLRYLQAQMVVRVRVHATMVRDRMQILFMVIIIEFLILRSLSKPRW